MAYLRITLSLTMETAFHTTGNLRRFGVDKALARDANGKPVLPATTIKGFLREKAELLLQSWGQPVCIGPEPGQMCEHQNLCRVCQVFGHPRRPSPLRFEDGHLSDETGEYEDTDVRSGVAISRYRRAAYGQRLFFIETTSPRSTRWHAQITGYFPDDKQAREAAALIALAAAWGIALGGAKSRGLGWLKSIETKTWIDEKEIPASELQALWREWHGGSRVG